MNLRRFSMALLLAVNSSAVLAAESSPFMVWAVDPLVKVFPDSAPAWTSPTVELRGGANEYLSGQIAVRADSDLAGLTARWEALRHRAGGYEIPAASLRCRFVGFVPVPKNTPNTPRDNLLFTAPAEAPDPLLEAENVDLTAHRTQPIWLTVFVPADAPPGPYEGQIAVSAGGATQRVNVALVVYPFVLPDARHLWVTNWFSAERIAQYHKVKAWSEEHWAILERYARNMAEHRQNVVLTPISLIKVTRKADGALSFDYTDFDRWVRLFEKAGACERIEIGHVASHGEGGWSSTEFVLARIRATDASSGKTVALSPDEGLAPLLRDLERHLAERNWLEKSMIHVGDEPALHNIESWRKASDFVHRAAPRLRRIDAIESRDYSGRLEVWVPKLNYFPGWADDYRAAQRAGNEVWFYTCLHPTGYYPNRFFDYPSVAVRILHWINWGQRLDGYLHWGWNAWRDDPFQVVGSDRLPPGDCFIVYPGKDGPMDSIRWEMMREGLQDYEEFWLLADKTRRVLERLGGASGAMDARQRSDEICRRIIPGFCDYEKDPAAFRAAKQMLLEELAAAETPPLCVAATAPAAETELVPGPISVEVYGVVEKGASVKVGGQNVTVAADGRFAARVSPSVKRDTLEIVVEKDSRRKVLRRQFRVREM